MGGQDQCDPAMLELFRAEMDAHVPVLSEGLLAVEKGQADDKVLEAMMRAAHSIKGAARIVGIDAAGRLAHVLEDCFSAAQGHRITLGPEAVDVLLEAVDALQKICAAEGQSRLTEPLIQAHIDRMAEIRDGRTPVRQVTETAVSLGNAQHAVMTAAAAEHRVTLPAVLDESAAESLWSELCRALGRSPLRLRFDFAGVRYLSATALALLASLAREADRAGSSLTVVSQNIPSELAGLLRMTGLDHTYSNAG